jgi:EAL domain-containing protein (putative c-di-GMP-specific phosphodiesterase class I)
MNAPTRGYTLDFIQSMMSERSGRACGWFNDLELRTVFQPTFGLPQKQVVGFEANLRGYDPAGKQVSPEILFGPVENYAETAMLDLLSTTMHVHNFFSGNASKSLLLVNLHPEVFVDYSNTTEFLKALFRHYHVSAQRIMIDIPGSALGHDQLDTAIGAYREIGCLIAVDDFGVDNTNLDSVWHTAPSLVKIGRSMIAGAVTQKRVRQSLPRAVSLLHEMGTLVMMEGIESEAEALIAIDTDADLCSGYFFGPLRETIWDFHPPRELLDQLWSAYKKRYVTLKPPEASTRVSLEDEPLYSSQIKKLRNSSPADIKRYRDERRPFINALQVMAPRVKSPADLAACSGEMWQIPGMIRCFMLDAEGKQIGADAVSPSAPPAPGVDFHELAGRPEGDWSRRDFFRRALHEPQVVQATRQYCSVTGYPHCVTFSIATRLDGKIVVICCDVDWTSHVKIQQH